MNINGFPQLNELIDIVKSSAAMDKEQSTTNQQENPARDQAPNDSRKVCMALKNRLVEVKSSHADNDLADDNKDEPSSPGLN